MRRKRRNTSSKMTSSKQKRTHKHSIEGKKEKEKKRDAERHITKNYFQAASGFPRKTETGQRQHRDNSVGVARGEQADVI